jgi:hypothetical protein
VRWGLDEATGWCHDPSRNTFGSNEARTRKVFAKLGLAVVGATHAMWIEERR